MDERAINGAAIAAINDLQLDCEIKDVRQSSGGDEWCIEFSGKYGRFCDGFQNQFGQESSSEVMREKIKGYLIKQVNKIRTTTGRRRRPAITDADEKREPQSGILAAPLRMVEELFDRVAGLTGAVVTQASSVTETARDTVADVATNISPVTIEVRSTTPGAVKKSASRSTSGKTAKAKKASPSKATKAKKAQKATKRATRKAVKPARKAIKAAKKKK
jgi:hypothetical protein